MTKSERRKFREQCFERDNHTCVVPDCNADAVDAHHIIERSEWQNGGYIPQNGASVCEHHHKLAETNDIPPQAFWRWIGLDGITPDGMRTDVNKWGDEFKTPPHEELREYHKYPSTRHLPISHIGDDDDTYHKSIDEFLDTPLVATEKMDGSNAMLVKDTEEPVRSRRGRKAQHDSFDMLFQEYWNKNVYEQLPENLQVFGEWIYEKHSIHYGCDGCCDERNQGPPLENGYFQVFGVFDTDWNLWLSWNETKKWAEKLGFKTTNILFENKTFKNETELYDEMASIADELTPEREGFVIRSIYPFHYGQFGSNLGKFVRENHVQTDVHWKHQDQPRNELK